MNINLQLTAKLEQRLLMTQQLRQAITLLQYNTIELKQVVQQFVDKNPLLEVEESELPDYYQVSHYSPSYKKSNRISDEEENGLENYAIPTNLRTHLFEQTLLCKFTSEEQMIAEAIIEAVDDNGRLTMSLLDLQATLNSEISINTIEKVLKSIQQFDPIGVAAYDMLECLIIQLEAITNKDDTWHLAKKILRNFSSVISLSFSNIKKMMQQLKVNSDAFNAAMGLIKSLNPYPGIHYTNALEVNIEPELYAKKIKGNWTVFLADSLLTNISINTQYQRFIKQNKSHSSYEALNRELLEAQWLLKGLKRRNETLLEVARYLVEMQSDFIEHGPARMKPLNIADVAAALNIHESTVSRVTTGKYIATPRGLFELKFFFPSHVTTKGGSQCSAVAVKEFIKEIIDKEQPKQPMSDEQIAVLLKGRGINIARRTVAKYREALNIKPSYLRSLQPEEMID